MSIRIIPARRSRWVFDFIFIVGPWEARLCLSRHGSFAYDLTDRGYGTRRYSFVRRFWSGWHRWGDDGWS